MLACPHCGTQSPVGAKFCPECGTQIPLPEDEHARDRSLRRLEDDMNREFDRLLREQQEELDLIEGERAEKVKAIDARELAVAEDLRHRRDQSIEAVMSDAIRLRELLDGCRGEPAPDDLVFKASDALVAAKSKRIGRKQLARLNKVVQDELNRIEERFAVEEGRQLSLLDGERDLIQLEAAERRQGLEAELYKQVQQIREGYDVDREELMAPRARQLLNETAFIETVLQVVRHLLDGVPPGGGRKITSQIIPFQSGPHGDLVDIPEWNWRASSSIAITTVSGIVKNLCDKPMKWIHIHVVLRDSNGAFLTTDDCSASAPVLPPREETTWSGTILTDNPGDVKSVEIKNILWRWDD